MDNLTIKKVLEVLFRIEGVPMGHHSLAVDARIKVLGIRILIYNLCMTKRTLDMIVTRRNDRMDKSEHQFNQFSKKKHSRINYYQCFLLPSLSHC